WIDTERRERDLHLLQVVLRVRPPHIELQPDAALLEAEPVVRDVRGEVLRIAGLIDEHPTFIGLLAPQCRGLRRFEEDDALALGDDTTRAERFDSRVAIADLDER